MESQISSVASRKPEGDIFIDDKAFNSERWDWNLNDFEIDKDLNRLNISLEEKYRNFLFNIG